ncbi:uncharacterized protein P884DRAFT_79114 [Thermothelomyces heterothallicus CBS 202.75]|uniref:uncharacterized protein n=1 Tax=Thermothelomyces heterothallicus CBS 202.75 TaxID=1149848 RepID=UPI0037428D7E
MHGAFAKFWDASAIVWSADARLCFVVTAALFTCGFQTFSKKRETAATSPDSQESNFSAWFLHVSAIIMYCTVSAWLDHRPTLSVLLLARVAQRRELSSLAGPMNPLATSTTSDEQPGATRDREDILMPGHLLLTSLDTPRPKCLPPS